MKKTLSLLLAMILLVLGSGCGDETSTPDTTAPSSATTAPDVDASQMFTDRDLKATYDEQSSVAIQLDGNSIHCDSDAVEVSGSTLTLKKDATYLISGSLINGNIIVDMDESAKPQLVLNNAQVTCESTAALSILNADKVFVTLPDGTSNGFTTSEAFENSETNGVDGTVFSNQDLTFNGSGHLSITSPAGHGIVCKDDLVFTGGHYTLNAASHGCDVNDSVRITGADLTITAGKDGIHCENDDTTKGFIYAADCTVHTDAQGDGISAGAYLQIENGTYEIVTGGGSENGTKEHSDQWGGFMGGGHGGRPGRRDVEVPTATDTEESSSIKGLKAAGSMSILGGSFSLNTADDALHAGSITISGGTFQIASGDDGVHADETLTITDCSMTISESYEALEALHVDLQGGQLTMTASDDGINAAGGTDNSGTGGRDGMFGGRPGGMGGSSNGSITISGGQINITASGDGLDANGSLTIRGGTTVVSGPTQGDTATLDYDTSGIINGGTFIGTGASGMAQSFSGGSQGVIALSVGQQQAGTAITLTDGAGNTLIQHTPQLSFSVVILSSPEILKGESYTITVGNQSGTFEAT